MLWSVRAHTVSQGVNSSCPTPHHTTPAVQIWGDRCERLVVSAFHLLSACEIYSFLLSYQNTIPPVSVHPWQEWVWGLSLHHWHIEVESEAPLPCFTPVVMSTALASRSACSFTLNLLQAGKIRISFFTRFQKAEFRHEAETCPPWTGQQTHSRPTTVCPWGRDVSPMDRAADPQQCVYEAKTCPPWTGQQTHNSVSMKQRRVPHGQGSRPTTVCSWGRDVSPMDRAADPQQCVHEAETCPPWTGQQTHNSVSMRQRRVPHGQGSRPTTVCPWDVSPMDRAADPQQTHKCVHETCPPWTGQQTHSSLFVGWLLNVPATG